MTARLLTVALAGFVVSDRPARPHRLHALGAIKVPLPGVRQPDGCSCGPACVMAICAYYGVGPETIGEYKRLLKTADDGTHYRDMVAYLRSLEFDVPEVRGSMTDAALRAALDSGRPVICSIQAYAEDPADYDVPAAERLAVRNNVNGHYVVAVGYDDTHVYFMDPILTARRGCLSWAELDQRWHDNEGWPDKPEIRARLGIPVGPGPHKPAYATRARRIE